MLSIDNYNYKNWNDYFKNDKIDISKLTIHKSWKKFIKQEQNKDYWEKINKDLSSCKNLNKIYPYPELIFNAFNLTPLNEIKVVILGQDPYHNHILHNKKIVPEAMGLSFSVPIGFTIPSSLNNIYENLMKYKQIVYKPKHGNLTSWAYQGCMMLNTSLTVECNCPNIHTNIWKEFTDNVIKYISSKCNNIVFVLWGSYALSKMNLIDQDKHKIIVSSHPSGLSYNKKLRTYPAFSEFNHFGTINRYLKKHNKPTIIWQT